jgi:hypothetical protein
MSKDMDLIIETAKGLGVELAAGCAAKHVLDANLKTNGDLDLSAITPSVSNRTSEQSICGEFRTQTDSALDH